jgi:two-component system, cell cycle sensor histidine kinase and response regulator CckA
MRALYDASPVGIVELDASGHAQRWNRAAESLFGWPPSEPAPATTPIVPAPALEVVTAVFTEGTPGVKDIVVGEGVDARELELVAVPLGEGARPEGVVVAAVDVTERKQVAEQLQHAQRMEAMARMAGGIAHDFNNVLMVINGYAELLLHRDLDDGVRVDVEAMRAAATRAAQFTRQLLTISRRQVVQPLLVDIGETIRALSDVLAVMLGTTVKLELAVDDPPSVLIDPAQFDQVLLNLSLNAKDAMPNGGTLTIEARPLEFEGATWAELTISDTGEGMDPVTAEHCFEPFFTTKDRTKGTGLGLSTAYGVVTQAGGDITVTSDEGEGTSFTIRLPVAPVEAVAEPAASGRRAKPARNVRVLVVDDEPDVRAIVADMLELDGHEVFVAADGPAALAVLDEADPEVLLTDVVMPEMRGPALAEEVLARRPQTKVILMSSHLDDAMAVEETVEGVMFLAKPFSADALADTLAAIVAGGLPAQGSKR